MAKAGRRKRSVSPRRQEKLSEAAQIFVVRALAVGNTPQGIVEDLRKEFAVEITRQSVQFYDPTVGDKPPKRWCDLYTETRKEFFENIDRIPISHEAVCLETLEQIRLRNLRRGGDDMAMRAVVEARKIRGGFYSNQRIMELANRGGEPFQLIVETASEAVRAGGPE